MTDHPDVDVLFRAAQLLDQRAHAMDEEMEINPHWRLGYPAEVDEGLGGEAGELAALFTPTTASLLVQSFRRWASRGRADPALVRLGAGVDMVAIAKEILRAEEGRKARCLTAPSSTT